jgi:NDP-sugar pyrophosphorylase family protein
MELSLVILAAGVGSRYGGLKQLDAVGPSGEAIIDYSAYDAARAGFRRAVLVVRPETEAEFRDTVGRRIGSRLAIDYVHQTLALPAGVSGATVVRRKPWGTGHAVLAARAAVSGRFAVINADDFYGAESYRSLAAFLRNPSGSRPTDFALQGFRIGPTLSGAGAVSRGLCRADREGFLEAITELLEVRRHGDGGGRYTDARGVEHRLTGDELVSMNMWAFTPEVFDELERLFAAFLERSAADPAAEFLLPATVQSLIEDGRARVRVLPEAGRWCGITYREDREEVAAHIAGLVARGVYPERLWG